MGRGAGGFARRAWAALVALSLAAFAFITTELLPIGMLTLIAPDLDRSRSQVGLLVTGYAVVVVLGSIPLARLTQRIPRRGLLGVTMVVFAAANAVAALPRRTRCWPAPARHRAHPGAVLVRRHGDRDRPLPCRGARPDGGAVLDRAALAPVLAVPLGTWLGQQAGWRTAFGALAGVGLAIAVAVFILLPSYPPAAGGAARGTAPDGRRFVLLLVATALASAAS